MENKKLIDLPFDKFEKHIISEILNIADTDQINKLPDCDFSRKVISQERENKINQIIK